MAATPPSLTTPPPPPPPDHQTFLTDQDYSEIFSFMPPAMSNGTQGLSGPLGVDGAIPDPRSLAPDPLETVDTNGNRNQQSSTNAASPDGNEQHQAQDGDGHDNSSGEDDEDDDSDDGGGEDNNMDRSWYSIFEEKREPVEDELRYWKETKEHSAEDNAYWEAKAFTDLEDLELKPGASGRIDFAVDHFNGTRERPNRDTVMRSEAVDIGGYQWRLKFYPKGNNTDHLSVYIENATMQAAGWAATEDFDNPALPFLASSLAERPKKRRCVSAQVCVVLYNPAETRQYEHRTDAHQFTKASPDYGWARFTHMRRKDLGLRNHFQRAPLLQDDKLAFKAYIRVVDDPTSCLWDHNPSRYQTAVSATSLRPFARILPILAADLVLLHFPPFRELVCKWQAEEESSKFVSWMNILLWKMLSRERSELYGEPVDCEQSDSITWLQRAVRYLEEEEGTEIAHNMLGTLDPKSGSAVSGSRLKTSTHPSVQAAVEAHEPALESPALLTLELERQRFDKEKRQWKRITNNVDIQDDIEVSGRRYKLFAFVTHCGELSSNSFKTYVRPHGPGTVWFGYSNDKVTCMTHKQALEERCGRDDVVEDKRDRTLYSFGRDRRCTQVFLTDLEVAHVVFYVRDDYADSTFRQPKELDWAPPQYVKSTKALEEMATLTVPNGSPVIEEKEVLRDQGQATKRRSTSSHGSDYIAGCATPTHWFMDEDGDVVMSDQEEEDDSEKVAGGETKAEADAKEAEGTHRTIDNLGCSYYSGEMAGSQYHGQGHLITLNGDEYTGSFSRHQKHGTGTMIYAAKGDTYTGNWSDDLRHGHGTYTEASTGNVFDGNWKEDKKSGAFTLTGTVTEEDKGVCGICYEREMNTAFYDCGHVVACFACAGQIEECPVCRRRIVSRLQLFGVKVSLE